MAGSGRISRGRTVGGRRLPTRIRRGAHGGACGGGATGGRRGERTARLLHGPVVRCRGCSPRPAPGEPRPQELQPDSVARQALLGERDAVSRTQGEQLFVAQAGAGKADPLARYVVDDEFGDLAYKDASFADKVLFWRKPEAPAAVNANAQLASEATPVDAEAEKARLTALTGDQPIIIAQKKDQKFKLPGL